MHELPQDEKRCTIWLRADNSLLPLVVVGLPGNMQKPTAPYVAIESADEALSIVASLLQIFGPDKLHTFVEEMREIKERGYGEARQAFFDGHLSAMSFTKNYK